jgi:hypothetical protein
MVIVAFVQPVLALDLHEILIGLVALIFVIIRQLLEANKNAGANRPKPPAIPQPQPQPQNPNRAPAPFPAPAAGQQADPLRAQVEEFLRRAGQPAMQNQPRPRAPQASQIEILVNPSQPAEQRTIGQPLRQADWRQTPSSSASPQSAAGTERARNARSAKPRRRKSVSEHVAEQVTSRAENLASQASKLGQRIVADDQQFDMQLKAKFDHTVGTLTGSGSSSTAEAAPPPVDSPAAQLAAMLANPSGIRQAVLVNEILRRPSDRW